MDTQFSDLVRPVLAPNPGPMTLDGTNSYLLGRPDELVVVDPGPDDAGHLDALAAAGRVALILITHHHADHTAGIPGLRERTGAPARAFDPAYCHAAAPLVDGAIIEVDGVSIRVLATPGHTADSLSFVVEADGKVGVLTGDTILGRGTTVLMNDDGSLAAYLDSLDRLEAIGPVTVLPAHGPELPDLVAVCQALREHRHERLQQIREALQQLSTDAASAEVASVTDLVYADVDPAVRFAAEASVATQLAYLREHP